MQARNNFLILSLGQLTKSEIWPTVHELAELSARESGFPVLTYPFHFAGTALTYGYDMLIGGNIEKYLKGDTTDKDLITFLKQQLDLGTNVKDKDVQSAWNNMCKMDANDKANLDALMLFLIKHDVIAIIVSKTNEVQYNFIVEQMKQNEKYLSCLQNGKIEFSLSYEKKTLSLQELAEKALGGLNANSEGKIYSLHRDVKDSPIPKCKFLCEPFNPSEFKLSDYLVKAQNFFERS